MTVIMEAKKSASGWTVSAPEAYILPPTAYVPNNPMPYLVYRNVLPQPITVESAQALIEQHGWGKAVSSGGSSDGLRSRLLR